MTTNEIQLHNNMREATHNYHTPGVFLQDTSMILSRILLSKGSPIDIRTNLISVVLLFALNSEVALKALILREGNGTPRTHNLKDMFDSLNDETKEDIKKQVAIGNFEVEFEAVQKSFVDWRYFYEGGGKSINMDFLRQFSETVSNLLLK